MARSNLSEALQKVVPAVEQSDFTGPGYQPPMPPKRWPFDLASSARVIETAILVALFLICEFPVGMYYSSPDAYVKVNETLDAQKTGALGLVATTTTASVAVSAIPDDVGTPIADQLADLSGKLAVVLAIIYLEKFLLTTLGLVGLRIFVPIGICFAIGWLWTHRDWGPRQVLLTWAFKLVVVGIALVTLVPVSAAITTAIDEQYKTSLVAEETAQEADETSATVYEENANQDVEQDQNILEMLGSAITSGIDALASGAADAANAVGEQLNKLIDAVAVTIVTSCLVPLAVLLLYFWLIKLLTGADFTGYVSRAQNAASSSVRKADSATRAAVKQHRASTPK